MDPTIVPITLELVDGFRAVLDSVARERLYLALLEAPPPEDVRKFVEENIRAGHPQLLALDGGAVVGWCDIIAHSLPTLRHSGVLGMGIVASHRGRGIGTALVAAALAAAKARGLTRIELTVRADNEPARALYERFGFAHEGRLRHYLRIDDTYQDCDQMALVL